MAPKDPQDRPILRAVTEWDGGFDWIADPNEDAQRASHALSTAAGVWLVDPVDADGLDDRVADLGEVAGVAVLHDRHTRDAVAVAHRHDVAVHVPDWMRLTREKLDAKAEAIDEELPGTSYAVHRLIDRDDWEEVVLVDDTTGTLVVPEALGTLPSFGEEDDELGLHPGLDTPPPRLEAWRPERILVGHGESVHADATRQLETALDIV